MGARADDPGGLLPGSFLSALDAVSPARLLAPHLGGPLPLNLPERSAGAGDGEPLLN